MSPWKTRDKYKGLATIRSRRGSRDKTWVQHCGSTSGRYLTDEELLDWYAKLNTIIKLRRGLR